MGLPLFIVPVESDVPSRSAAKNPAADPTHARSPIRRSDQRRQQRVHQPHEIRDHRSRLIAALRGHDFEVIPAAAGAAVLESQPARHAGADETPTPEASPPRTEFEDLLNLIRDDEHRRHPPRPRWPLHSEAESRHEESFLRAGGPEPRYPSRASESGDNEPRTYWGVIGQPASTVRETLLQRIRSNGSELHARRLGTSGRLGARMSSDDISLHPPHQDRPHVPDPGEYLDEYRRRRRNPRMVPTRTFRRHGRLVRYDDGLGDRDRSLSPEGDGVWDTLQSTLTPDPQPPSAGSSFVSTTASVAASQTTASSSSTSITNLDESAELPCDPVADESDTDGDAGDADGHVDAPRQPPSLGRRSYADVAADVLPVPGGRVASVEWLSDMQRIIQGLSSREDIPDEWWSAAGLSRSVVMGDD